MPQNPPYTRKISPPENSYTLCFIKSLLQVILFEAQICEQIKQVVLYSFIFTVNSSHILRHLHRKCGESLSERDTTPIFAAKLTPQTSI